MKVYVQHIKENPLAKGENSKHARKVYHEKPLSEFAKKVKAFKKYLFTKHGVHSIAGLKTLKKYSKSKIAGIQYEAKQHAGLNLN